MEFQPNPYLIWQLIPGIITLGIGIYIQSRPKKKRESNVFSVLMFGGSLWAFANAIQLITPNPEWQKVWNSLTYLGVMLVPTSWFLLSIKLTGFARERIEKVEKWFWFIPAFFYITLLTNGFHRLFFVSSQIVKVGGIASLENVYGFLFYAHTAYSYVLLLSGMAILGISLATNFKRYGAQAYGLIIGVLAPLLGNIYFLFGSVPPGFPDPTPIIFTVTGLAFSWAIFGGRLLEVVPLAHDVIVQKLSTGTVILDVEKNILEINPVALDILGLSEQEYQGKSLKENLKGIPSITKPILAALNVPIQGDQELQVSVPETGRTFDVIISRIDDNLGNITGWLIQLSDISQRKRVEANLVTAQRTFETVLDTLHDSYFEADEQGYMTYANDALCKNLEYPQKEDVIGKHFRHFVDRNSFRTFFKNFKMVFETKTVTEPFQYEYRTRSGRIYFAETTVSPIMDGTTVIGTRGVIRDITDRVMAEKALRSAKDEVDARAEELAAINRVAMIVNQSLDLNDILQKLCVELTNIFPIRNAGIGLLTPDQKSLEIVAFYAVDPNEESALGMLLPLEGNSSSEEVIKNKKSIIIQDAQNDPRTSSVADISKERGTKSIMIVPLLAHGQAIGTIGMPAKNPEDLFYENEIKLAETIASQAASAIDNAQLHAKTESALGVAERDLEIGRQIQSGFFPEKLPEIPGWEIATHFHAARQVAGDFYDVFQFRNSNFTAFIIADVCDKGVGAALFMVLFRSLLRAFSEILISASNVREQLQKIILSTNNFIAEYHGRSNMFATLFFGILDSEEGVLYYVNGGHEPPVMLDKNGSIIGRLMPTGPAVGMFPDLDFQVEKIKFKKGDVLVGFTDGTTDAKNSSGQLFSEDRLLKNIAVPWTSIFSMVFELSTELQKHIGEQQQFDDITLIAFRRKLELDVDQHAICRVAQLENLEELREFVISAAEHSGLNHEDAFAFKLTVDEICTNIIQYGYEGKKAGLLSLFFNVESNIARLIIRDDGKYFPLEQTKNPDLEAAWDERELGGFGLYFAKELMDEIYYDKNDNNINQFVLVKELGKQIYQE